MRLFNNRLTRRIGIPGTIAAGVIALGGTAALAAMLIFGTGTIDAAAAEQQPLTASQVQLTGTLAPGMTVGAKAVISNPNGFPVIVDYIVVKDAGLTATGGGSCPAKVTALGEHGTFNGEAGWKQVPAAAVTIGAGGAAWVEITQAVKQDATGDRICGVHADFLIVGHAGS